MHVVARLAVGTQPPEPSTTNSIDTFFRLSCSLAPKAALKWRRTGVGGRHNPRHTLRRPPAEGSAPVPRAWPSRCGGLNRPGDIYQMVIESKNIWR